MWLTFKMLIKKCCWDSISFFLLFFAVSEQDSETMETSQQEPRTPSEESSPVTCTIILKINNINAPVRLSSLEEPSAVCSSKQAKCDQIGRFRHISVTLRTYTDQHCFKVTALKYVLCVIFTFVQLNEKLGTCRGKWGQDHAAVGQFTLQQKPIFYY